MDKTTIKAGSLFAFSTGEYSDYGYNGHFLALENIPRDKLVEIAAEVKSDYSYGRDGPSIHNKFIDRLIREGLVLSITCSEIHIGCYGQLFIDR